MSQNITLRRAAKIRNRLAERLAELRGELKYTQANFNVFDPDVSTQIETKSSMFASSLTRFMAVSSTLYNLRSRIDSANATANIGSLLARREALLGTLSVLSPIASLRESVPTSEQISARLTGAVERAKATEYAHDFTSFIFVTNDQIKAATSMVHDVQIELDSIQDKLESINATTTIELTDSDLALLQSEHLI